MKKAIIFLVIIAAIFAAIAGLTKLQQKEKAEGNPYNKENLKATTIDQLDDPLYQNLVMPDELEKMLADKQDATVYFYSPTCPHCLETTPVVVPLAKKMEINLLQYNVDEFSDAFDTYNFDGTPTIIHFEDGKESARIDGYHEEKEFKDWFSQHVKQEK